MTLSEIKARINQYKIDYADSTQTAQVVRLETIILELLKLVEEGSKDE